MSCDADKKCDNEIQKRIFDVQLKATRNSQGLQEYFEDLYNWEEQENRSKNRLKEPPTKNPIPIRGTTTNNVSEKVSPRSQPDRITLNTDAGSIFSKQHEEKDKSEEKSEEEKKVSADKSSMDRLREWMVELGPVHSKQSPMRLVPHKVEQKEVASAEEENCEEVEDMPCNFFAFEKLWKQFSTSPEKQWEVLKRLTANKLPHVFGECLEPTILAEILQILQAMHEKSEPEVCLEIREFLLGLSLCQRFEVNKNMLSRRELAAARNLIGCVGGGDLERWY
eukprot:Platyproteum_vivax@DN12019_c0_g1_i1.p1